MGLFSRLKEGLAKTRDSFVSGVNEVFSSYDKIDDELYEELEELRIMGDMGVRTTNAILDDLRDKVEERGIRKASECKELRLESIREQMKVPEGAYDYEEQTSILLMIGVNGVGKTTTVGKLAALYKRLGKKVIMAAADTFRAAATEQLVTWSERAGVPIITGHEGADPASVVYDAVAAARARKADMLIVDTASRLHNKKNLMAELGKIYRILGKEFPEAHIETLLVLDGTTGQNALMQAREFADCADITGLVLTKLDGTARGGIAIAIQSEMNIPVKFIGVGEKIDDLQKFDPRAFVDALFDIKPEEEEEEEDTGFHWPEEEEGSSSGGFYWPD